MACIDNTPTYVYKCCPDDIINETCVICQQSFKKKIKTIKLPCGHHYHYKCFIQLMCNGTVDEPIYTPFGNRSGVQFYPVGVNCIKCPLCKIAYTINPTRGLEKICVKLHATQDGRDVVQYLSLESLMSDLIAYIPVNQVTIGSHKKPLTPKNYHDDLKFNVNEKWSKIFYYIKKHIMEGVVTDIYLVYRTVPTVEFTIIDQFIGNIMIDEKGEMSKDYNKNVPIEYVDIELSLLRDIVWCGKDFSKTKKHQHKK